MRLLSTLATLFLGAALVFSVPVHAQDDGDYMPDDFEESEDDSGDDFEDDSGDDGDGNSDGDDGFEDDGDASADEGFEDESDSDDGGFEDDSAGAGDDYDDGGFDDGGFDDGGFDDFEDGADDGGFEDFGGYDSFEDEGFEDGGVGTVAVGVGAEEEDEPQEPWHLYVGVGQAITTMSLSTLPPDAQNDFDSGMIKASAGVELFPDIDLELQFGAGQDAEDVDEVTTDSYYGLFVIPSTTLFDVLEISMPVGYAATTVGDEDFNSPAFGLELNLPLQAFAGSIPDIRLVAGYMIYYQEDDARLYGFNAGLRYDFNLGGDPGWDEGGGIGF